MRVIFCFWGECFNYWMFIKPIREIGRVADRPRSGRQRVTSHDVRTGLFIYRTCAILISLHLKLPLISFALTIAPFTPELWEIDCAKSVVGHAVRMSARYRIRQVVCVIWPGWLHMHTHPPPPLQNFQWGSVETGPFILTSPVSLFFVQIVDVAFTNVVENASPTLSLSRGIDLWAVLMIWGGIFMV